MLLMSHQAKEALRKAQSKQQVLEHRMEDVGEYIESFYGLSLLCELREEAEEGSL